MYFNPPIHTDYLSEWDSAKEKNRRGTKDTGNSHSPCSVQQIPTIGQRRKDSNASTIQNLRATLAAQRSQADCDKSANDRASRKIFKPPHLRLAPSMELKDVNFQELTQKKFGDKVRWQQLSVNDQVDLIREALKAQTFLIDPNSDYMKYWDIMVVLCLMFTAIVTPFEIAFLKPAYDSLYVINRIVDFVFVKDMAMQFFLKVKRRTRQGTVWIRNRNKIAQAYLRSWFIVDLLCIIPYDDITNMMDTSQSISKLKVFRMMRVMRLFKLTRILKASRVVKRWENRMSLKTAKLYLVRFSILIIVSCHWMACIWGFFGILEGSNLECRENLSAQDVRLKEFPLRKYFFKDNSNTEPYNPHLWQGQSWVVNFAAGRAAQSPTDPCSSDTLYVASIYWAVMTITSIGYGDIIPVTLVEYVACSICMMLSSVLWAYIIGAACAVMSKLDPEQTEFEQRMDAFNAMAEDQDLPVPIRYRGREYIRESRFHAHYLRNQAAAQSLSNDLRGTVARQMAKHYLDKIWFFENTCAQFREDAANKFTAHFYERREIVDALGKLCVVERGAVGRSGRILVPWSYWGEDMLLRLESLRYKNCSVSLAYTEIVTLSREDLSMVLVDYAVELKLFRRAAVRVALSRAVAIYKEEKSAKTKTKDVQWVSNLFQNVEESVKKRKNMKHDDTIREAPIGEISASVQEQLYGILNLLRRTDSHDDTTHLERKMETIQTQLGRLELSVTTMARAPPTIVDLTRLKQTMDPVREQCRQTTGNHHHYHHHHHHSVNPPKDTQVHEINSKGFITNVGIHANARQEDPVANALDLTCCVSQAAAGRRGFTISTQ